jgi:hypothetical protein
MLCQTSQWCTGMVWSDQWARSGWSVGETHALQRVRDDKDSEAFMLMKFLRIQWCAHGVKPQNPSKIILSCTSIHKKGSTILLWVQEGKISYHKYCWSLCQVTQIIDFDEKSGNSSAVGPGQSANSLASRAIWSSKFYGIRDVMVAKNTCNVYDRPQWKNLTPGFPEQEYTICSGELYTFWKTSPNLVTW